MRTKDYITKYQPILNQVFKKACQNNRLSHAYLLSGEPGTPLLKIAKYLAKCIICNEEEGVACEECPACKRIENESYLDLIVVDGKKNGTIKKDEIAHILEAFDLTAIEKKGVQVYIINLVEIMRPEDEAVHTLLKFLEEPHPNVYAFLTTNNIERVLPTIISRCQVLPVQLRDRQSVIDETLEIGVPLQNAQILSKLYNDPEEIKEVANDPKCGKIISLFDTLVTEIKKRDNFPIFFVQKEIIPNIKDKESARLFIDLLSELFHEMVAKENNMKSYLSSYDKILTTLKSVFINPVDCLYITLDARTKIEVNVTISLILDHLMINLVKGSK